jgi:phage N-6-adenine-methyltransferase
MNRTTPMEAEDDIRESPRVLFDSLDRLHRFTLDACATHENALCESYFTEQGRWDTWAGAEDPRQVLSCDGLQGPWDQERVWCNPPYSNIAAWVNKAWFSQATLVYMLIPSTRCEQPWWQEMIEPYRDGRGAPVGDLFLTTSFLPGRWHFTIDGGQPILNPKTGKRSSPKFGLVGLLFQRKDK